MNTDFRALFQEVAEAAARHVLDTHAQRCGHGQEWLDERQAARLLALSPKTLEKMRALGSGPDFVRVGRLVRYPRTKVLEWARSREAGGDA